MLKPIKPMTFTLGPIILQAAGSVLRIWGALSARPFQRAQVLTSFSQSIIRIRTAYNGISGSVYTVLCTYPSSPGRCC